MSSMNILKFLVCFFFNFVRIWMTMKCYFDSFVFLYLYFEPKFDSLRHRMTYWLLLTIAAFVGKYKGETFSVLPCSGNVWWILRCKLSNDRCFLIRRCYIFLYGLCRLLIFLIFMMFLTFGTSLYYLGWVEYCYLVL